MSIGIGIGIGKPIRGCGARFVSGPLLTIPALEAGQTFTVVGGTYSGDLVTTERRVVANGVVMASAATYVALAGDVGKIFKGQERVRDSRNRWSPWFSSSNTITIPDVPPYLTDAQWTWREALVPSEAALPRLALISVTPAPTGDDIWQGYSGDTEPTFAPTGANCAPMTGSGPYVFIATAQAPLGVAGAGALVYVRTSLSETDDSSMDWASDFKTFTASTKPYDWTDVDNGGAFEVLTGTVATGDLIVRVTEVPTTGVQVLTNLEYDVNESGSWSALGGLVPGDYTLNFTSPDPLNPVGRDIRLRVANANGYSLESAPTFGVPKASAPPAAGPAPILTGLAYASGPNEITQTSDQAGDYYWIVESNSTVRDGAYIKAALGGAGSGTLSASVGVVSAVPDFSALTTGNWYFKSTLQNAELTYATPETPLLLDILAPVLSPSILQSAALNSPDNVYDNTKTFTLPSGITNGSRLFLFVSKSTVSSLGSITIPAGWSEVSRVTDNSGFGQILLLTKLASGDSGASVAIVNSNNFWCACTFYETNLPYASYDVTWNSTNSDPPSISPPAGSREYILICGATRTRGDAVVSAAPTNYSNLRVASSCLPGGNVADQRVIATSSRIATITTEDPVTFTAGSPSGTGRASFTLWAR